jgi:hypothetical protein
VEQERATRRVERPGCDRPHPGAGRAPWRSASLRSSGVVPAVRVAQAQHGELAGGHDDRDLHARPVRRTRSAAVGVVRPPGAGREQRGASSEVRIVGSAAVPAGEGTH